MSVPFENHSSLAARALVTGGAGLIGQRVLELLSRLGERTRVLASPGTEEQVPRFPLVEVVAGDLLDAASLTDALRDIEIIYHLATLWPGAGQADLMRVNAHGTENLLRACARATRARRLVFVSSVAVYGAVFSPREWPVAETRATVPAGNETLRSYGLSKLAAERVVQRQCAMLGMDWTILRPSTVYGPGGHVRNHAQEMIRNVLGNARVGHGPAGSLSMQMVHVDDMAEAAVAAGLCRAARDEIVNIAGGEVATGAEIAGMIRALAAGIEPPPIPGREPLVYSIEKAQRILGFKPRMTLRLGFEELLSLLPAA